jgi:DNA-directed RNA polymerase specialized sigma24 family protein
MPSLLGREIFRSRATALPARAFEDAVVFVCDVERCLRDLEPLEQRLIAFCVLEDHSEWEAARQFQRSQSDVSRRLGHTLDLLHETFCRVGLLKRPPALPGEVKRAQA